MIGVPALVLGLLLLLTALVGGRVQQRRWGPVGTFLLSPVHPSSWLATLAILLGALVELVAFGLVVGAFSSGASLLFIGIGIVFIGVGIEISRMVARVERWRASLADPRPLLAHPYRPYGEGLQALLLAVFGDLSRWRDVVYVFVALPLTILELVVVLVSWSASIALLSVPVWFLVSGEVAGVGASRGVATPAAMAAVAGVIGLLLLPTAAVVSRGLMVLHRAVIAGLLCESEQRRLQRRVETLEGSRRAVLDVEASELHRIERDLHDGAQQRLVSLTIDLSLAAERIETDPASARTLVEGARDQARQALAELRDLVRGIAPPILLDRGLVPALSALAARSPVPTAVVGELPAGVRPPEAVERAAYFVVAEALANVAKHASATRCEIRCRAVPRALVVEVWDDGAGGALSVPGGGLAGLAGRVEALDGMLEVESPDGGPTIVRATLPVVAVRQMTAPPEARTTIEEMATLDETAAADTPAPETTTYDSR